MVTHGLVKRNPPSAAIEIMLASVVEPGIAPFPRGIIGIPGQYHHVFEIMVPAGVCVGLGIPRVTNIRSPQGPDRPGEILLSTMVSAPPQGELGEDTLVPEPELYHGVVILPGQGGIPFSRLAIAPCWSQPADDPHGSLVR
jgi:hypothetical protein